MMLSDANPKSLSEEEETLLYGAVEVDEMARVAFELECQKRRAERITFSVALWRMGAFSIVVALFIEAAGILLRQRFDTRHDE